ncbi:thioredoxin family protein [Pirellulaceae bacterium SH449]
MVRTASTMLPLGTTAPNFSLPTPSGEMVSRDQFREHKGLVVMFICNHCPYVKHVAPELARVSAEYMAKGIGFVGISSNDIEKHPDDAPGLMAVEAKRQGYLFPYLFDEDQSAAQAYKAACTPDIFVFDSEMKLVYRGQLDDSRPKNDLPLTGADLRQALDRILEGKPVSEDQKPSIGCNIKWKPGAEPEYFDAAGIS